MSQCPGSEQYGNVEGHTGDKDGGEVEEVMVPGGRLHRLTPRRPFWLRHPGQLKVTSVSSIRQRPRVRSQWPRIRSQWPHTDSQRPRVRSQWPRIRSQWPHTDSQRPRIRSRWPWSRSQWPHTDTPASKNQATIDDLESGHNDLTHDLASNQTTQPLWHLNRSHQYTSFRRGAWWGDWGTRVMMIILWRWNPPSFTVCTG